MSKASTHTRIWLAVLGGLTAMVLGAPAAAHAAGPSVSVGPDGTLRAVGGGASDTISIGDQADPACPGGSPCYQVSASGTLAVSAPCVASSPPAPSPTAFCPSAAVARLSILGRGGNDYLTIDDFAFGLGAPAVLDGGSLEDVLLGASERDVLVGGTEDDRLFGGGGDDIISGNPGADKLVGEKGKDRIVGGPGFDDVIGGLGADHLFGSAGNDGLDGAQGKDVCHGGKGRDTPRSCERRIAIP